METINFSSIPSKEMTLEWYASSLHPEMQQALQSRYNITASYPDRWLMKSDIHKNGDMTDLGAIQYLVDSLQSKNRLEHHRDGLVDLYIADGGKDIGERYNLQEILHQDMILGEFICCFKTLALGGNAMIKLYTICTQFMRSLLVFASLAFQKVHLVKPITSTNLNTEVYLVMKTFTGVLDNIIELMEISLKSISDSPNDEIGSPPLFNTHHAYFAIMISASLRHMNATYTNLKDCVNKHISRCQHMERSHLWKLNKIGDMSMETWLKQMHIKSLK